MTSLTLNGKRAADNVRLLPGKSYSALFDVKDPEGDALAYRWEVMPESQSQETGGDRELTPQPTLGPAAEKSKRRDDGSQSSQQVSEIIGQVMHFDENMLNGRGGPAGAFHHSPPSTHREVEEDEDAGGPPEDEMASEHGSPPQEETVENDDYNSVEKEEYIAKGREESMHFSKLLDQLEDDPGLNSPTSGSFKPSHKLEQGRRFNGFKATAPKLKRPLTHRTGRGCAGKRCDIAGGIIGARDGHFEPPNDEEVPYDVGGEF